MLDDGTPAISPDARRHIKIPLPPIRPLWVAWVIGQVFFCLAIVVVSTPYCLAVALGLTGLSILLDCIIVVMGSEEKES